MNTQEILKAKAAARAKAESIINPVIAANGTMTPSQNAEYDGCVAEVKRCEDLLAKATEVSGWQSSAETSAAIKPTPAGNKGEKFTAEQKEAAFNAYLRAKGNVHAMSTEMVAILNETTPADGGYTVPTILNSSVIEKKLLANVFRSLPGVNLIRTVSTENFPVEGNPAVCEWTDEQGDYPGSFADFRHEADSGFQADLVRQGC